MDKFDDVIKDAYQEHEPSKDFVDNTMNVINGPQKKSPARIFKILIPSLVGITAVVVLIVATHPFSDDQSASKVAEVQPSTSTQSSTTTKPVSPEAVQLPAGTDDATLTSDLNNINGAMNQEQADQSVANSGINDAQQEITIPTD